MDLEFAPMGSEVTMIHARNRLVTEEHDLPFEEGPTHVLDLLLRRVTQVDIADLGTDEWCDGCQSEPLVRPRFNAFRVSPHSAWSEFDCVIADLDCS